MGGQLGLKTVSPSHLYFVHEKILQHRDNNYSVSSLFLDFAKAFDSVNHQIILSKLEHYGIRGLSFKLFISYLTNKKQYTGKRGDFNTILLVNV